MKLLFLVALGVAVCESAETLEMHASGTTNPSKLHWKYMETLEEMAGRPILATYRAVGSGTGQAEFIANNNHFGGSEVPLSQAQMDDVGGAALHFPHVMGAISFFYNIPSDSDLPDGVHLTASLLAKIFSRKIKTWDHEDILAENPDFSPPEDQAITVIHRVKGSSSTYLVSEYLNTAAEADWGLGKGKSINWPDDTVGAEGSAGVSGTVSSTAWSIGYIDSDHGHNDGLTEIELKNKDGNWLTSKMADIGSAADSANLPASDGLWEDVSLVDQAGEKAWPMVAFSYMLVREDLTGYGEVGALVKAYVEFANSPMGQDMVGEFGFSKLPKKVLDLNAAGLAKLKVDSTVKPFVWELSTMANDGTDRNVFSVKRRQYSDYQVEQFNKKFDDVMARLEVAETLEMHGSGTTNPSKLHWKYMETLEEMAGRPILATYRAVGSGTGQAEYIAGSNHFGGSEVPLSQTQMDQVGGDTLTFPHVIGAISFFYNIPADKDMEGGVKLTAGLLAKIFSRKITTWDHEDILAENDGFAPPAGQNIEVVHRVKGSSSTSLISEYLNKAAEADWGLGQGKTVNWPADTIGAEGSAGVSGTVSSTEWSIGYVDSDHGHNEGLTEIELQNKDGYWLTSKMADIGSAADSIDLPASDGLWEDVSLVDGAGEKAWPMVAFSYMLVRKDLTGLGEVGALVKAYVEFSNSETGQDMVGEFGFSKLPKKVLDLNAAGLAKINVHGAAKPFTWEFSTKANAGADPQVFSVKRRQYSDYMVDQFTKQLDAMQDRLAALEGGAPVGAGADAGAKAGSNNREVVATTAVEESGASGVAVAGLIVACLALLVAIFAAFKVSQLGNQDYTPASVDLEK